MEEQTKKSELTKSASWGNTISSHDRHFDFDVKLVIFGCSYLWMFALSNVYFKNGIFVYVRQSVKGKMTAPIMFLSNTGLFNLICNSHFDVHPSPPFLWLVDSFYNRYVPCVYNISNTSNTYIYIYIYICISTMLSILSRCELFQIGLTVATLVGH